LTAGSWRELERGRRARPSLIILVLVVLHILALLILLLILLLLLLLLVVVVGGTIGVAEPGGGCGAHFLRAALAVGRRAPHAEPHTTPHRHLN
jgi:hypothetical protein